MKMNLKRWGALGTAAVSLAGAMVVTGGTTAAHADTRCSAGLIAINESPGGDPISYWNYGHAHNTGKHYVSYSFWNASFGKYVWQWYADNDGGSDGDTRDTYYGSRLCDEPAPTAP
ncbi:hypothetical protein AB0J28_48640 [Streptosporangium canum]|uniref:hypothetical protein n=1 Tax=Streptosporangium canum TaxID=324952 RepID=UPI0034272E08